MNLYQRYLDYLNQAMPDISGIFRSTPTEAVEETTEETVAQPVGLTPEQLALLYPQNQGGRDDGPQGNYGAFGNLLKDSKKQFEVARYNPDTKQYDILDTVDGYLDPISGIYKTYDGKNIRHAGLEIPSVFQGIATLIGLDKGPQSGDIGSIAALEKLKRDRAIQTGIMTATDDSDPGIIPAPPKKDIGEITADYYGGDDGADRGIGPGLVNPDGSVTRTGSRRGASDIPDRDRGSYATDDTASFF